MRIVFMGTPEFSVAFLRDLHQSTHQIVAVVTQPDRPAGRGQQLKVPPVKVAALELGLPVLQPESPKDPLFAQELVALQADLSVVVAYSMLPKAVLAATRWGAVNLHGSLLPSFRGAAPVQWAVASGASETGLTIFRLDEKMDHGPILAQVVVPIGPQDTSMDVLHHMVEPGAQAIRRALDDLSTGLFQELPQNHELASPAPKLRKEDGSIDWSNPAWKIQARMRGFTPWPGAYTQWKGKSFQIHQASVLPDSMDAEVGSFQIVKDRLFVKTGDGLLELLTVQVEGKKAVPVADFIRGLQGQEKGRFGV